MSAGVFPALDVQPLLGRFFTQQEDDQRQQVVVLSYATWQSRLHGDRDVLGKKILLDRKPYLVIGVMPRNFEFPLLPGHLNQSELWVPMSFNAQELSPDGAGSWNYSMVGRLKPGVSAGTGSQRCERVARETMRNYPAFMAGFSIHPVVRPLNEETVEQARPLIRTLFLAVAVVLLIACANLAGLLLVRAIRRQREIAVRMALGASSATLLWQAILESLLLSVTGGIVGLDARSRRAPRRRKPAAGDAAAHPGDRPGLAGRGFCARAGSVDGSDLRTGAGLCRHPDQRERRSQGRRTHRHLRRRARTPAFRAGHYRDRGCAGAARRLRPAVAQLREDAPGGSRLSTRPHAGRRLRSAAQAVSQPRLSVNEFNRELVRRVQQLPGVKAVGLTSFLPASGNNSNGVFVAEGYVAPKGAGMDLATTIQVEGDYFRALGIPLLHGRFFTPEDKAGAQLVVIVNHKLAEQSWPGQDPIGKRLRLGHRDDADPMGNRRGRSGRRKGELS